MAYAQSVISSISGTLGQQRLPPMPPLRVSTCINKHLADWASPLCAVAHAEAATGPKELCAQACVFVLGQIGNGERARARVRVHTRRGFDSHTARTKRAAALHKLVLSISAEWAPALKQKPQATQLG